MLNLKSKKTMVWSTVLASLTLAACGSSSNNVEEPAVMKNFRVTISNVTANQPLSPVAIILHKPAYHMFQAGQMASTEIEYLAEGGSNQELLDQAGASDDVVASASGAGPIPPGGSETIDLETADITGFNISVATMLVNTNDAFAARSTNKIAALEVGGNFSLHIPVWDAGTEANTEAAGSMPGPVDGGEGFNASRDGDADFVAIHQGVVTHADGLATSVLGESHRFINPGALLRVERIK